MYYEKRMQGGGLLVDPVRARHSRVAVWSPAIILCNKSTGMVQVKAVTGEGGEGLLYHMGPTSAHLKVITSVNGRVDRLRRGW